MEQTIGEQITARRERARRIDDRMEIITWLAKQWQNFRLIQEAALWRDPAQLITIDEDLANRYYRSQGEILVYVKEAEKLGLVDVFSAGKSHAYWITRDKQSLAGQLIEVLFQ